MAAAPTRRRAERKHGEPLAGPHKIVAMATKEVAMGRGRRQLLRFGKAAKVRAKPSSRWELAH